MQVALLFSYFALFESTEWLTEKLSKIKPFVREFQSKLLGIIL